MGRPASPWRKSPLCCASTRRIRGLSWRIGGALTILTMCHGAKSSRMREYRFVDELRVKRWRGFGDDRIYVSDAAGLRLGWQDLRSGRTHVDVAERGREVARALESWHRLSSSAPASTSPSGGAPEGSAVADPTPEPASTTPDTHPRGISASSEPTPASRRPALALPARIAVPSTEEAAWRARIRGEERVAVRLERLLSRDPRWRALHAIPSGDGSTDIDHLVVGPGGLFALKVKQHRGGSIWVAGETFKVDGKGVAHVRNCRFEAQRAAKLLSDAAGFRVSATGVIVVAGAMDVTVRTVPAGLAVLEARSLVRWLRRQPDVLSPAVVRAVFEAARRASTWRMYQPSGRYV